MLKLAIIQLAITWQNKEANFSKAEEFIKNNDADLFVLPELFSTGFTMDVETFAEDMQGKGVTWFKTTAQKYGKAIMGSIIIKEDGKFYNRMIFATPEGKIDFYNKRHLFRMGEENTCYTGGKERKIFEYKGFRILPQICYDLRFPVFARNRGDYDLAIYVACWPEPRTGAWSALLRARAIENQCFIAGVNMVGADPKLKYKGASAVINFRGETLTEIIDEEDIKILELDLEELKSFTSGFPAWMDRDEFTII